MAGGTKARYDLAMSRCYSECRYVTKLAKHTHVAGANCCSSFKNVFSKCGRGCGCSRCRDHGHDHDHGHLVDA